MSDSKLKEIVRRFPENGMKLLLENPQNVRDLLLLTEANVVDLIDVDRLALVQTTFVERDYRHVESDVVLLAPLRRRNGARSQKAILIYILIEHQSEPDRLMPLRLLEYVVQIFKAQTREWSRSHRSFAGIRLQPVLPVVFYTGSRRWDTIGSLVDLIEVGELFKPVTPALDPLFINLGTTQSSKLESEGGFFGWVLRLVQQRRGRLGAFKILVKSAIRQLETMPPEQRLRWLELLSYIHALVYHERGPSEHPVLQEAIETSLQRDDHRQEVSHMRRTIADVLKEEGLKAGLKKGEIRALQRTLIRLLRARFGDLPEETVETIKTTKDVKRLDAWLGRTMSVSTLEEMRIGPAT